MSSTAINIRVSNFRKFSKEEAEARQYCLACLTPESRTDPETIMKAVSRWREIWKRMFLYTDTVKDLNVLKASLLALQKDPRFSGSRDVEAFLKKIEGKKQSLPRTSPPIRQPSFQEIPAATTQ